MEKYFRILVFAVGLFLLSSQSSCTIQDTNRLEDFSLDSIYTLDQQKKGPGNQPFALAEKSETAAKSRSANPLSLDHESKGDAYYEQHRLSMAFVEYDKALLADPNNEGARLKKGVLYLERDMYTDALGVLQELLKINPENANAHHYIGRIYFKQGKHNEAEKSFSRSIELDDKNWRSYNYLGILKDYKRDHVGAVTFFRKAIAINPNRSSLYNNIGLAYAMSGAYDSAISAFRDGLRVDPDNPILNNNLGVVLAKTGKYDEALDALSKGENDVKAHNNLGCFLYYMGKKSTAETYFEKATKRSLSYYEVGENNLRAIR